ncbi:hypothetical protein ABH007_19855 [Bacteroides thetaiotaomicron]|uniref:hypothetical protein n=1 Tax=Bacteroides thetaiotaomicron TaxID=818 RepID=UPI00232E16D3|nr:hypothetical protein [Bacteroides thetaiotaomicron]MDC2014620.1 hypothetical protein [Bacteroides thetaiotaomicron]MDC2019094.1 hypothetical protein [Bacteroides thetaiotaomicron]MDC2036996.1 hypothetical protein [Bacteroides thetaiotaomicron]MDC2041271.1 hypothetical protein [Bacteroides thetaiotaomicron]MDC2045754.1 hypothetical protein [Bacteroides thetaiotaomicron]
MIIAISEELLFNLIEFAEKLGRKKERIELFKEPKFVSQNKAHILYGKGNVTKWVKAGIVKRYKDVDGKLRSRVRYDSVELEAAAFKCNCIRSLSPLAKAEIREIMSHVP